MNSSNLSSKSAGAGMLAAVVASLCCITPVFSFLAGLSGIAATFSWMEPFRPYLITMTVGILGFAWYQKLKPRTEEEIQCACEEDEKPSFWQSRNFLTLVTVFAALMLAFPSYSHIFYPNTNHQNSSSQLAQDTTKTDRVVIKVQGMTCAGCEAHIEHEVGKMLGVQSVQASYANGTTTVEYFPSKLEYDDIVSAIKKTGYMIIEKDQKTTKLIQDPGAVSFYKVPLVCHVAPSIGCGSRSKPVLYDFEKSTQVNEAWLNRAGTVIAIVWEEGAEFKVRRDLVNMIFTRHQANATELLTNDYTESYESFEKKVNWFRGSDVDKLSKEEASIIADQIIKPIKEKTTINAAQEKKLREKIRATFYDFFLNYQSLDELGDPKVYKAKLVGVISFGDDLLGEGTMPSVEKLWNACSSASKSCSHEGCSGSSCSVPKKL